MSLNILRTGLMRGKGVFTRIPTLQRMQTMKSHDDYPPQPFDNMPFKIRSRFAATLFFSLFFGVGFYAPYLIVWYQMAKKTL